jgi:DNA-binding CsgD family transcriptional regulator
MSKIAWDRMSKADREERCRVHREEGYTYSQIAEMYGTNKNVIAGQIARMARKPDAPVKPKSVAPPPRVEPSPPPPPQPVARVAITPPRPARSFARTVLVNASATQCRFPLWDLKDPVPPWDLQYVCSAPTDGERVYCVEHAAKCLVSAARRSPPDVSRRPTSGKRSVSDAIFGGF